MEEIFEEIIKKHQELENSLADPAVYQNPDQLKSLSQKKKALDHQVSLIHRYQELQKQLEQSKELLESGDPELQSLAQTEREALRPELEKTRETLEQLLIPADPNDLKPAIVEVRAGVGGEEASLFAEEITRMIQRWAESQDFEVKPLNISRSDTGGLKEMIFEVENPSAYGKLKFEGGVHRVQRIPSTESQGRIHTSAVSVVVLPQTEAEELVIHDADLRIDVFRASGNGGQSVNTTDSAVRITHLPSGLVVTCQDEKSQLKNKNKALGVLRSRLFIQQQQEQSQKLGEARLSLIKSGDRSDKIRTYNFPQDRVTDHRIAQNFSGVQNILSGNLEKLFTALSMQDQKSREEGV